MCYRTRIMTTQKVPEMSEKLKMVRMRRNMVIERWHMGFNTTKQKKRDSATTMQSHIWDQEIITVSISFCSAKMNITSNVTLLTLHSAH